MIAPFSEAAVEGKSVFWWEQQLNCLSSALPAASPAESPQSPLCHSKIEAPTLGSVRLWAGLSGHWVASSSAWDGESALLRQSDNKPVWVPAITREVTWSQIVQQTTNIDPLEPWNNKTLLWAREQTQTCISNFQNDEQSMALWRVHSGLANIELNHVMYIYETVNKELHNEFFNWSSGVPCSCYMLYLRRTWQFLQNKRNGKKFGMPKCCSKPILQFFFWLHGVQCKTKYCQ